MKREELERLEQEDLVEEARRVGVARPEVLTREELIDAIEAMEERSAGKTEGSQGFLSRMRSVLATFVEKGLDLPAAAEMIRGQTPPAASEPIPMATVTLAQIYAAQGHPERALAVLEQILRADPSNRSAQRLQARLRGEPLPPEDDEDDEDDETPLPPPIQFIPTPGPLPAEAPDDEPAAEEPAQAPPETLPAGIAVALEAPPAPPAPPEVPATASEASPVVAGPPRPAPMLDEEPLPERYDTDEIVLMPVDPTTLYLYWELREDTLQQALALQPGARLELELSLLDGNQTRSLGTVPVSPLGDTQFTDLPAGARCLATLGLRGQGGWAPLLRSEPRQLPPRAAVVEVASRVVHWQETPAATDAPLPPPLPPPPAMVLAVALRAPLQFQGETSFSEQPPAPLPTEAALLALPAPPASPAPLAPPALPSPPPAAWAAPLPPLASRPLGSSEHRAEGPPPTGASERLARRSAA